VLGFPAMNLLLISASLINFQIRTLTMTVNACSGQMIKGRAMPTKRTRRDIRIKKQIGSVKLKRFLESPISAIDGNDITQFS
jgi:hypothetical protein